MSGTRNDFTITSSTTKKDVNAVLDSLKQFSVSNGISNSKMILLNLVIGYARDQLATFKLLKPAASRYVTCSRIFNQIDKLDDLHFYHFAIKELERIPSNDNSTLRGSVLPTARRYRDAMLAPERVKMEKAFLGMAVAGAVAAYSNYSVGAGSTMISLGLMGYLCSRYIMLGRLDRSLDLKMNKQLVGANVQIAIDDGMSDEVTSFQRSATSMLGSGLALFDRASHAMHRVATLGGGQQQLAVEGAPRVEIVEDNDTSRPGTPK